MSDMALVPATPDRQELEAMTLAERVALEDAFGEAHELICTLNDVEIARLAAAGMSQRAIGETCGKSQHWVRHRLGRRSPSDDSPNQSVPQNGDGPTEVVDGVVVDDDPDDRPERHLPDEVAPDAQTNLRTQTLRWFDQGRHLIQLMEEEGAVIVPKDRVDKAAIKREATQMAAIARRLKGAF